MKKFKYVGNGEGIPGLPHDISESEIGEFNEAQLEQWHEALASGQYAEVSEPARPVRVSNKRRSAQLADEGEQA